MFKFLLEECFTDSSLLHFKQILQLNNREICSIFIMDLKNKEIGSRRESANNSELRPKTRARVWRKKEKERSWIWNHLITHSHGSASLFARKYTSQSRARNSQRQVRCTDQTVKGDNKRRGASERVQCALASLALRREERREEKRRKVDKKKVPPMTAANIWHSRPRARLRRSKAGHGGS